LELTRYGALLILCYPGKTPILKSGRKLILSPTVITIERDSVGKDLVGQNLVVLSRLLAHRSGAAHLEESWSRSLWPPPGASWEGPAQPAPCSRPSSTRSLPPAENRPSARPPAAGDLRTAPLPRGLCSGSVSRRKPSLQRVTCMSPLEMCKGALGRAGSES
jgi:hypothetical protein